MEGVEIKVTISGVIDKQLDITYCHATCHFTCINFTYGLLAFKTKQKLISFTVHWGCRGVKMFCVFVFLLDIDLMELSPFELIFIVCSYVVLLHNCPRLCCGFGATKLDQTCHILHVPVLSQKPVIQWLSFVYVLHICFSFISFT